ncbi:MAG: DUF2141 domain-containing protein [Bacteroidia bacterium]
MVHAFILTLFASVLMQKTEISEPAGTSLVIEISGIRNSKGHVLIALFNQASGFPDQSDKAFRKLRIPANAGTIKASFDDLPAGSYAFGVVHDENDNQKLDTGLFGIPKEGFVFSRNAMGTMGPPSFDNAAIKIETKFAVQVLKIKYW